MLTESQLRTLALKLKDTEELPHFERTSFRVKKTIFATYDSRKHIACLMLSPINQSVYCSYNSAVIYPVPNSWGKKGATYFELKKVRKDLFADALRTAYHDALKKA